MQLTRPGCDCGYLGASFRAINRSIAVDIGRADYSFADSHACLADISRTVVSRCSMSSLGNGHSDIRPRGSSLTSPDVDQSSLDQLYFAESCIELAIGNVNVPRV